MTLSNDRRELIFGDRGITTRLTREDAGINMENVVSYHYREYESLTDDEREYVADCYRSAETHRSAATLEELLEIVDEERVEVEISTIGGETIYFYGESAKKIHSLLGNTLCAYCGSKTYGKDCGNCGAPKASKT